MKGRTEIPGQISRRKTKRWLKNRLTALPPPPARLEHTPADRLVPLLSAWSLDARMDATPVKNSELLALAFSDERAVVFWRADGTGWPHVEIQRIDVDLDRYPMLEIVVNNPEETPFELVVKLIDETEGHLYQLSGKGTDLCFDLRESGLQGKKRLTVRLYCLGHRYVPPKDNQSHTYERTRAGDYIIVERLQFVPPRAY